MEVLRRALVDDEGLGNVEEPDAIRERSNLVADELEARGFVVVLDGVEDRVGVVFEKSVICELA